MFSQVLLSSSILLLAATQTVSAITTTQVVISAKPSSVTFTASRVSDSSKYAGLASATVVTSNGKTETIFPKGFVWNPVGKPTSVPSVPNTLTPSYGNEITVTATTGTPPPTVTFTTSQIASLTGLKSTTTSNGLVIFPLGIVWVPIAGVPVPPTLPAIPSDYVPPEPTSEPAKTTDKCSTRTPVVTVVISYPTNTFGDFQTTTSTKSVTDKGDCLASATTTTSTVTPPVIRVSLQDNDTPDIDDDMPADFGTLDPAVKTSLLGLIASLGYENGATATKGCAKSVYASAVPTAAAFIGGLSPSFCSDWAAAPTKAFSKTYSAKDVKSKKREAEPRRLGKRTPPPAPLTSSSYPGWTVKYSWTPSKNVASQCRTVDYCNAQESAMLASCEGYSLADAQASGSIEDGCGKFEYSITVGSHLDFKCVTPPPNPIFSHYAYRADAIQEITNFCTAHDGNIVKKGTNGVVETAFSATFAGQCAGDGTGQWKISKSDCISALTQLVDNCDTNTQMYKHGGTVTEVNTCAQLTYTPTGADAFACYPSNKQQGWTQFQNGISVSNQAATDAINQFCTRSGGGQQTTLTPGKSPLYGSMGSTSFIQDTCTTAGLAECQYYYNNDNSRAKAGSLGDLTIRLSAAYAAGTGCGPQTAYSISGDECKAQLSKLIGVESGQCPAVNSKYPLGSFVEQGPHGCVLWTMFAEPTHA